MKKDKKWLIEEINNLYEDYIQHDWNNAIGACEELVDQLDEPQKVVVPKWFDEWVKSKAELGFRQDCLDMAHHLTYDYSNNKFSPGHHLYILENPHDILSALLYGYEVEKEKLYWVRDKNGNSLIYKSPIDDELKHSNGSGIMAQEEEPKRYQFTEQEIKDYDERYCAFAVEVEDNTEI